MESAETKRPSRAEAIATIALFVALLWLPLVWSVLEPDATVSTTEKRGLATLPNFEAGWGGVAAMPDALATYYDDHLGLRTAMIRAWAWLHIEAFGVSPSRSLVVGRDGWLFFGDAAAIAQYRGIARFTASELEQRRTALEARQAWLAERGIAYLLVLVPNKHRVYGEFMPPALPKVSDESQLDQLVAHLASHSTLPVLDLRPTLARAKTQRRIYHKTDTHWNDLGAYAAYRAILERLGQQVPALANARPARVRPLERTTPGMGLARIVGLSLAYPEHSFDLVLDRPRAAVSQARRAAHQERTRRQLPIALGTGDASQPTAVVFRDSFANALIPFLSESFERVVYVWERDVNPKIVEIEKPDVVIHQIAERFLAK